MRNNFFPLHIYSPYSKFIVTLILVVSNLCAPKVGFAPLGAEDFDITSNLLFPLFHANWLHLLCNLWCVWLIRPPYCVFSGIVISFLCSLLPEPFISEPIMGISGILFAMIGAKFGKVGQAKELIRKTWLFFLVTAFLPNIACLYHLYCIALGYLWGAHKDYIRLWLLTRTK